MRLEGTGIRFARIPDCRLARARPTMDAETCEKCCSCEVSTFHEKLWCPQCNRTHYLRARGWYKPNQSPNWYCYHCVLLADWQAEKRAALERSEEWLCGGQCQLHAQGYRLRIEALPLPVPAASSSTSSTVAPAGVSQREWALEQEAKSIGTPGDTGPVQHLLATASSHMGHVGLEYMCPLGPQALRRMNPKGMSLMQRFNPDIESRVLKRPPVIAVRRALADLRGIVTYDDPPSRKRACTLDQPGAAIPLGETMDFVRAVPADAPVADAPDTAAEPEVYRVCTASASSRALTLSGESTRGSLQLSIATWNSGAFRGFRTSEAFRGGRFHVLLGQEFTNETDPPINDQDRRAQRLALQRMGWTVGSVGWCLIAGNASSTASVDMICSERMPEYETAFAQIVFTQPHSELTELRVGTLHVNHERSKHPVAILKSLATWANMAKELAQVDIVGCDWNSAFPSLTKVLERFGGGLIIRTGDEDCTGFIVPSWSKLLQLLPPRATYFPVPVIDLGWGRRDADSHWMVAAHWRRHPNVRQRTSEAQTKRKRASEAARKAKKRAGVAAEAKPATAGAEPAAPEPATAGAGAGPAETAAAEEPAAAAAESVAPAEETAATAATQTAQQACLYQSIRN